MARPTKNGDEKRDQIVPVRFSHAEKKRLEELAQNDELTVSDFIRNRILGSAPTRTVPTPEREVLLKLLAEAGKQGSNINQIARALNRRDGSELVGLSPKVIAHALEENTALTQLIRKELQHGH